MAAHPTAAPATPASGPGAMFTHGLADAKSKKGEDAPAMKPPASAEAPAAYAIFDGHGGKPFSHTVAHHTEAGVDHGPRYDMLARLLEAGGGALPSDAAVEDIFWQTDEEVGALLASLPSPNLGGCTAQILMALPVGGGVQILQAWVGDSTAVTVDMKSGKVLHATFNHNPDQGDEAAPLLHMAAVNKACRKKAKKDAKREAKREAKAKAKASVAAVDGDGKAGAGGTEVVVEDEEEEEEEGGGRKRRRRSWRRRRAMRFARRSWQSDTRTRRRRTWPSCAKPLSARG